MRYWVVGGDYTDTSFARLAPGAHEERIGPFASYGEAHDAWSARARASIDYATIRYRIIAEEDQAA